MNKLSIRNLSVYLENKLILSEINLDLHQGKINCLMGPNGSGKSTLAQAMMGHPAYRLAADKPAPELMLDGRNLAEMPPDERSRRGLFLAFQNPVSVPGVNVANLLRVAVREKTNGIKKGKHNPALNVIALNENIFSVSKKLAMPKEFLIRGLNEEFSGGEKKKLEMLQALILSPKFAIFDEIDTGLDVDALKIVANGISQLKKNGTGVLIITHYQRLLKYAKPDFVHILIQGRIVASGGSELALEVEKNGYRKFLKQK